MATVFLLLLLAVSGVSAIEKLSVTAKEDGDYVVVADGVQWFESGVFRVRHEGKFWGPDLDNMERTSFLASRGSDEIGSYTGYEYAWKTTTGSLEVHTYIADYEDMPVVIFTVNFISGLNSTNFTQGNSVRTCSSWPAFALEGVQPATRGYVTWAGNMAATIKYGSWSADSGIYGNIDGGFPLVVFDSDMKNTVVMSPFNNFMSSMQSTMSEPTPAVTFGPMSSATSIPPGFAYSTVLVGGSNVTGTMRTFGELLRGYYHKDESYMKSDFTVNYLGYYTDNGACYYYTTDGYPNYEEVLVAVKEDADKNGLPFRYMQIDSWWYFKGPDSGVKNWTAMPSVFPNGIQAVVERTGLRLVAHNRWWSPTTDYAKQVSPQHSCYATLKCMPNIRDGFLIIQQNGGKFNFIVDKSGALPLDADFWDYLISSSQREWSLMVYEQDWLDVQLGVVPELLSTPGLAEMWLQQMGEAAQRYGVTIQ